MAITTYAELKAAAASWLVRGDLSARIVEFISLAEAGLNRTLRVRQMEGDDTATISTEFYALPSDFLEAKTFRLTSGGVTYDLLPATVQQISASHAGSAYTSVPRRYALTGAEFQLYPIPDQSYSAVLTYYQRLQLSDADPTNWLLTQAPDVYLYGTLLQSAPFLRDAEALAAWSGMYRDAVAGLKFAERTRVGPLQVDPALVRPAQFDIARGGF